MRAKVTDIAQRDHGNELMEFIILLPLLILIGFMILQLMLAGQTILVANSAAREGARAYVTCESDWQGYIRRSTGGFKVEGVNASQGGHDVTVSVQLHVPILSMPVLGSILERTVPPVTGSATMFLESCRLR